MNWWTYMGDIWGRNTLILQIEGILHLLVLLSPSWRLGSKWRVSGRLGCLLIAHWCWVVVVGTHTHEHWCIHRSYLCGLSWSLSKVGHWRFGWVSTFDFGRGSSQWWVVWWLCIAQILLVHCELLWLLLCAIVHTLREDLSWDWAISCMQWMLIRLMVISWHALVQIGILSYRCR